MTRAIARSTAAAAVLAGLTCASVLAQPPIRLGTEFQVNVHTTFDQDVSSVDIDDDGNFVVVWQSYRQDDGSGGWGVFARRFNSTGVAQAAEFQVNTVTLGNQRYPSVGMKPDGSFVVAWETPGQEGYYYGIFARRFDASGAALASEFRVNTFTAGHQRHPSIALDAGGAFVIVWESNGEDGFFYGIFAQRFDSSGTPQGPELQVNTYTPGAQQSPTVARDTDGDFVVAWHSFGQDGDSADIFARRFSSTGTLLGSELQVNTYTPDDQTFPSIALAGDGDFVIAWVSDQQDGSNTGIFARRFDSAGTPKASEFQVPGATANFQFLPAVSAQSSGEFMIAWQTTTVLGGDEIVARRYDSTGTVVAVEFQVNTHTQFHQQLAAVALNDAGRFVVSWESEGQDGSADGVFAQRFGKPAILDIDADGTVAPLTDGLLIVRFLFGFTGTTLTSGVVDLAGCGRCDATNISAYLETLI